MQENSPDLKWMTASELMEKYPGFENLPSDYIGTISYDAGIVKVKNALRGYRVLSRNLGADLRYNTEVVGVTKNEVELKNGDKISAKNVVICCGKYTIERFDKEFKNVNIIETETFTFGGDTSKLQVYL
jgi:glycine/D-amino acid oxidase-like deaminating enzyme